MRLNRRQLWLAAVIATLIAPLGTLVVPAAQATSSVPRTPGPLPAGGSGGTLFSWRSSGPLISARSDPGHSVSAIKDPSVVHYGGRWHVFASIGTTTGQFSMVYLNFSDWSQAAFAPQYHLDQTTIGKGYRAAPEVFYFAPQKKWYLVYQTGNASYSTTSDINDPTSWSAPKNFYPSMPDIIRQNIGHGSWVDMWVICNEINCYLFSSDDNGHLYRSQTTVAHFPNGFSEPVIALQDSNRYNLFEASNVYKVKGTNQYLLLVEAIGGDDRRYFRSWTSTSITGPWTALAATESNPFARSNNVTFDGAPWTKDISHGEMLRDGYDQTLTINPCHMRYLYQGKDPSAGGPYNTLPWKLAMLTEVNATCGSSSAGAGRSATTRSRARTSSLTGGSHHGRSRRRGLGPHRVRQRPPQVVDRFPPDDQLIGQAIRGVQQRLHHRRLFARVPVTTGFGTVLGSVIGWMEQRWPS